jgi:hypothetical protein
MKMVAQSIGRRVLENIYERWLMMEIREKDVFQSKKKCCECNREFDLFDERDSDEWHYGHDCEAQ